MARPSEASRGSRGTAGAARRGRGLLLRLAFARRLGVGFRRVAFRAIAARGLGLARGGLLSGVLEIRRVPAAAFELEARSGEHLHERFLAARRAHRDRGIAPLLEELLLVAAARALVLVKRHSSVPGEIRKIAF